jgi:hypothetical protein
VDAGGVDFGGGLDFGGVLLGGVDFDGGGRGCEVFGGEHLGGGGELEADFAGVGADFFAGGAFTLTAAAFAAPVWLAHRLRLQSDY